MTSIVEFIEVILIVGIVEVILIVGFVDLLKLSYYRYFDVAIG